MCIYSAIHQGYDSVLQPICRSHFRASFFWWRILMDLIDMLRYVMRSILTSSALISKDQSTMKQSINCSKLYRFSYWPSSHYTKEDYSVIWCQTPIIRINNTKFTSKKCILINYFTNIFYWFRVLSLLKQNWLKLHFFFFFYISNFQKGHWPKGR